jgi:hypothetical protein
MGGIRLPNEDSSMTEWTSTIHAAEDIDAAGMTRPVSRTIRRSALRPAASRRALYADAREEARLVRGRNAFVWQGRVLPIGIPLAAAAGLLAWRGRRSTRDTLAVIAGIGAASYLEARVEWSLRRRAYRRRRDDE